MPWPSPQVSITHIINYKPPDLAGVNKWGETGSSPQPFFQNRRKVPWFCKKMPWFGKKYPVHVRLWFKFTFKNSALRISWRKHTNFLLRDSSFVCRTWSAYQSARILRNLPCPQKVLVGRLPWAWTLYTSRAQYANFNAKQNRKTMCITPMLICNEPFSISISLTFY